MVLVIFSSTNYQTLCIFELIPVLVCSSCIMSNPLLQQLTASQTMSNIECCNSPISGLADYSSFQNELPHFDDETYSQLNNNILPCKYYDELSPPSGQQRSFLVLHINIRSLPKKFDDFYDLLYSLPQPPVIIALSQTRINLHPLSNFEIPGYTFYYSNSPSKAGGVGECTFRTWFLLI